MRQQVPQDGAVGAEADEIKLQGLKEGGVQRETRPAGYHAAISGITRMCICMCMCKDASGIRGESGSSWKTGLRPACVVLHSPRMWICSAPHGETGTAGKTRPLRAKVQRKPCTLQYSIANTHSCSTAILVPAALQYPTIPAALQYLSIPAARQAHGQARSAGLC